MWCLFCLFFTEETKKDVNITGNRKYHVLNAYYYLPHLAQSENSLRPNVAIGQGRTNGKRKEIMTPHVAFHEMCNGHYMRLFHVLYTAFFDYLCGSSQACISFSYFSDQFVAALQSIEFRAPHSNGNV